MDLLVQKGIWLRKESRKRKKTEKEEKEWGEGEGGGEGEKEGRTRRGWRKEKGEGLLKKSKLDD